VRRIHRKMDLVRLVYNHWSWSRIAACLMKYWRGGSGLREGSNIWARVVTTYSEGKGLGGKGSRTLRSRYRGSWWGVTRGEIEVSSEVVYVNMLGRRCCQW